MKQEGRRKRAARQIEREGYEGVTPIADLRPMASTLYLLYLEPQYAMILTSRPPREQHGTMHAR